MPKHPLWVATMSLSWQGLEATHKTAMDGLMVFLHPLLWQLRHPLKLLQHLRPKLFLLYKLITRRRSSLMMVMKNPSYTIRFLNPNCKNPSSAAWLGKNHWKSKKILEIWNSEAKFEIYLKIIENIGNLKIPKQSWKFIRNSSKILEIFKYRRRIWNLLVMH